MVTHEYICNVCDARFRVKHRIDEPGAERCPAGHRDIQKVFSPPTILFKGPGFYVTDHAKKGRHSVGEPQK
jgi:putative FmdB family regulatory protein